nr:MAG TPA: hypothetical protein [Caudoviricetes sp.]
MLQPLPEGLFYCPRNYPSISIIISIDIFCLHIITIDISCLCQRGEEPRKGTFRGPE